MATTKTTETTKTTTATFCCDWCRKPFASRKAMMSHTRGCTARIALQGRTNPGLLSAREMAIFSKLSK